MRLGALKGTYKSLTAHTALERIGFTVAFDKFSKMAVDDAHVILENAHVASHVKLAKEILKARTSSMLFHTSSYLGRLALFASDSRGDVERAAAELRSFLDAFDASQVVVLPTVQHWRKRSVLNGNLMHAVAHFLRKDMLAEIVHISKMLFKSLLQTKMNEDVNKESRGCEARDTTSKLVRHFKQWHVAHASGLLKAYDRAEIAATCAFEAPRLDTAAAEQLFSVGPYRATDEEPVDFKGILRKQTWPTFDAASVRQRFAELRALRTVYEKGDWNLVDHAWKARLIPPSEFIFDVAL